MPEDVFILKMAVQTNFPNVIYFDYMAFLMQRLDLKMELAHVMLLYEFSKKVSKIFNQNLVTQHEIFLNAIEFQDEYSDNSSTPRQDHSSVGSPRH